MFRNLDCTTKQQELVDPRNYKEANNKSSVLTLVYSMKMTPDGFTYLDPAQFHAYFAADLPAEQAAFMARSQVLNLAENFKGVITAAAWRTKPSWMLVAGSDRIINPDLERWYAKRANSRVVEVSGASHCVYISHPKEVAALIQQAARATRN